MGFRAYESLAFTSPDGIDEVILLPPHIRHPRLKRVPIIAVATEIACPEPLRYGDLFDTDDDPRHPPAQQIPERRHTAGIDDGDVEIAAEAIPHHGQRHRHAAQLRLQQMAVWRPLRRMLGGRMAGAFQKVDQRGRNTTKAFARLARRREVARETAPAAAAAHEGEIERPPGQPHERHIHQHALEEKLEKRDAAGEYLLQDEDIDPALVIAAHQIPGLWRQPLDPGHLPAHALHQRNPAGIDRNPALREKIQGAVGVPPHRGERQQELGKRDRHHRRKHDQHVEEQDQRGNDALRRLLYT